MTNSFDIFSLNEFSPSAPFLDAPPDQRVRRGSEGSYGSTRPQMTGPRSVPTLPSQLPEPLSPIHMHSEDLESSKDDFHNFTGLPVMEGDAGNVEPVEPSLLLGGFQAPSTSSENSQSVFISARPSGIMSSLLMNYISLNLHQTLMPHLVYHRPPLMSAVYLRVPCIPRSPDVRLVETPDFLPTPVLHILPVMSTRILSPNGTPIFRPSTKIPPIP